MVGRQPQICTGAHGNVRLSVSIIHGWQRINAVDSGRMLNCALGHSDTALASSACALATCNDRLSVHMRNIQ